MKAKLFIFVLILILAGGGGTAYWYGGMNRKNPAGQVRVSGNIEAIEAQVAFKIPGRVVEQKKDEGEKVKAGEVVAILDTLT